MPNALIDIPDVYSGVIRPVVFDTARFLIENLRLPEGTEIFIPGDAQTTPMNGGSMNCCSYEPVKFMADTRLKMTFTEEPWLESAFTTAVKNKYNPPIWEDNDHGIVVRPIRRFVRMNCELEFTAQSKTMVQRITDYMATRVSSMMTEYTLSLEYSYLYPDNLMLLLMHAHQLIEKSAKPTNKPFQEFFAKYRSQPTTVLEKILGGAPRVAVLEKQEEVLGWFDFTDTPAPATRNDDGSYTLSMNFMFHYERPVQLDARWPLLIHNQLISESFRPQTRYHSFYEKMRRVSSLKDAMDHFRHTGTRAIPPYIQLPEADDWMAPTSNLNEIFFINALIMINGTANEELVDLKNLSSFRLSDELIEYIEAFGITAFDRDGIFRLEFYENDKRVNLDVDIVNGVIISRKPLDVTKFYHMRFGVVDNWLQIPRRRLECLRRYPRLFYQLARFSGLELFNKPFSEVKRLGVGHPLPEDPTCKGQSKHNDGVITSKDVDDAIKESTRKDRDNLIGVKQTSMRTVMFAGLMTARARS